ncbi:MAG: hypothetical protein IJ038_01925 [Clostridia bacterium]|nr:hypothetical protein [Clostridia bacterium]
MDNEKNTPSLSSRLSEYKSRLIGFCTTRRFYFDIIFSVLFLALSVFTLVYYITGPALEYFHSDCADSLIWAQATVESGDILSENFSYAALLPFGSPIWMVPVLKIFGFTMKAQTVSMVIFALIFVLSALSFFRSMKWSYALSSGAVFCLSMFLSASVKLREIMWEHVIYYSLGVLFLMLTLNLAFRFLDKIDGFFGAPRAEKIKAVIYGVLLLLMCAGCAADGFQVLALSVIPVLAAVAGYAVFDSKTRLDSAGAVRKYTVCAVMLIGALIGFLALDAVTNGGEIYAGYENAYSAWSAVGEWRENAELFVESYFSLAGVEIETNTSLMAPESLPIVLKALGALIVLVCPFILLFSYNKLRDKYSKMVALAHAVVFAVIMFGFICGRLSNANWRLTPLFASSVISTMVYVKHLIGNGISFRRVGVLLAAALLCVSLANMKEINDMPRDKWKDDPLQTVAQTLADKGYGYGYATFWNSAETALRSDGKVQVVNVEVDGGKVEKRRYQTMDYWFDGVEGQENYFLLLSSYEYASLYGGEYWNRLTSERNVIDSFTCEGYYIVVFDGNIIFE